MSRAAGWSLASVAERARANLRGFDAVTVFTGSFEQWDPAGERFDAVFSCNAFHWVDPDVRFAKVPVGGTRIEAEFGKPRLHSRPPLLAQQALYYDDAVPDLPHVIIVCTAGGILQGDRQTIEIALAAGAEAQRQRR